MPAVTPTIVAAALPAAIPAATMPVVTPSTSMIAPVTWVRAISVVPAPRRTPRLAGRSARLVVTWQRWRRVIARLLVVTRLVVIARLRRHVDAPFLIVGRSIAIVVGIDTTDDRRRLGVHLGFVITGACVTPGEKKGQHGNKQGLSIHGGLPDRDLAQPATLVGVRKSINGRRIRHEKDFSVRAVRRRAGLQRAFTA